MRHPLFCMLAAACAIGIQSRTTAAQAAPLASAGARWGAFGVIDGVVTDSALSPIASAAVAILQTSVHVETGPSGRFRIVQLPAGRYLLTVRRLGFREVSAIVDVVPNDTLRFAYTMEPVATELDTMVTTDRFSTPRLAGFEYRRAHEVGGRYITRAQIEAQAPTEVSDLLRRVSGLRIVDSSNVLVAISSRGFKTAVIEGRVVPVQCTMPIVVDGFLKPSNFWLNSIPPNDIHGIEVYVGPAGIPPEFNGAKRDTFCGIIMIWTRSGSGDLL